MLLLSRFLLHVVQQLLVFPFSLSINQAGTKIEGILSILEKLVKRENLRKITYINQITIIKIVLVLAEERVKIRSVGSWIELKVQSGIMIKYLSTLLSHRE